MRNYAREQETLGIQLLSFNIESAQCVKEQDRAIIYSKIRVWFGSLDIFNRQVRTNVRACVLATTPGRSRFPLNFIMYVSLPGYFHALDLAATYLQFEDMNARPPA